MIGVQIWKCVFQSLLLEELLLITGGNQKLSKIDEPWSIGVNYFQYFVDVALTDIFVLVFFKHCN